MRKRSVKAGTKTVSASKKAAIKRAVKKVAGGHVAKHTAHWTEQELAMLQKMYRTRSALVIALKLKKPLGSGAAKKLLGLTKTPAKKRHRKR